MAVAVDQGHGFKPFARPPRCKLQSFTQLDYKMLDFTQSKLAQTLENAFELTNIHKSSSTPCLSHSSQVKDDYDTNSRIEIIVGRAAPRVRAMVVEVAIAMASGVKPEPASSGLGGAYFLRSQNGDTIAVAKPIDEEPLALNNPKGLAGRMLGQPGMKCSIRIGETGLRESAAYFLDHDGFAGVPPTALVRFSHVKFNLNNSGSDSTPIYKIASLQRFVNHDSDAGDLGPSSFSVTSVHHIGILDVRLMNLDRHAGNILVRQGPDSFGVGTAGLVPIDHGFCLPEALDDPYFEWLHWPQALIPFSDSEVDYISSLDPYKDAELLRTELPSIGESSIRVLVLCTIFLKQATAHGLCLADIGEMMTREFCGGEENWSTLENLCINAKASLMNTLSDDNDSNKQYEKEVDEMFQFDNEHENDLEQVADIPHILQNSPTQGKPPKIPRFSSMSILDDRTLFPENKSESYMVDDHACYTFLDNSANGDDNGNDNPKTSGLMRSRSFPIPNYNNDGQCISFGEMDDEEWRLFLESFEKLLPEAFEERRSMGLSKQRLGSSCEF
ncbi:Phosphatidylinositol 4-kinase [Handroanthus impetiginosus]|uniref:1-phosphatidylinositol 4-kinase n=1 Tax=Handroanthus impetiginosus TaxID=429701 RepID=A0A2G9I3S3_9LAMI|nr:Phosphatidylinositol 4-kinase [Handroanthus impetiginosus]